MQNLTGSHPLVRLVIVQGPLQLLNVMAILNYQKQLEDNQRYCDVLVMGGFCSDEAGNQEIEKICLAIAQVWNFNLVFGPNLIYQLEQEFYSGRRSFDRCVRMLQDFLGIENVNVIYIARNWQLIHELFLAAYPDAYKIACGDGFGYLDSIFPQSQAVTARRFVLHLPEVSFNPDGFIPVNEAYLMIPVELNYGAFDQCRLTFVPPKFFKSIIQEASTYIEELRRFCSGLVSDANSKNTFILTSNLTEAQIVSNLGLEISLYLAIVTAGARADEILWVKQHPRQIFGQAEILVEQLRMRGYDARTVPANLACLPIELFTAFLSIQKVISLSSSSCVHLAYVTQCKVIFGCGEKIANQYFCQQQEYLLMFEMIISALLRQAYTETFQPISVADFQFSDIPQGTLYFGAEDAENPSQPQTLNLRVEELNLAGKPNLSQKNSPGTATERARVVSKLRYWQSHPTMVAYFDCLPAVNSGLKEQIHTDSGEVLTAEQFTMYKTAAEERLQLLEHLHQQAEELRQQNERLQRKLSSVGATAKALVRNLWRHLKKF